MSKSFLIFGNNEDMTADLRHAVQSALRNAKTEHEKQQAAATRARSELMAHRALPWLARVKIYFTERSWMFSRDDILLSELRNYEHDEWVIGGNVSFLERLDSALTLLVPDGFNLSLADAHKITTWL